MPWTPDYTQAFLEKIKALRHRYQRMQVRKKLDEIRSLLHPKDKGGKYLNSDMWGYPFGGQSFILCSLDEDSEIITFEDLVI